MGQIAFRRIGGRVIPINVQSQKQPDKHKNQKVGAALVAAGVGVGVGGAKLAAGMTHESAFLEDLSRQKAFHYRTISAHLQGPPSVQTAAKLKSLGIRAMGYATASKALEKSSFKVRNAGQIGAAVLIGGGLAHAVQGDKNEKNPKTKTAITAAGALGGAFAVRSAYLHGMGHRGMGMVKQALKDVFKRRHSPLGKARRFIP